MFNDNWPDNDGNGLSDSRDVAEYYAARRAVPTQNLLAVSCSNSENVDYEVFYSNILAPVHAKLETYDGSVQFKDKIYYILTCYGVPVRVNTHNTAAENPVWPGGSVNCAYRALDQYLIDVYSNYNAVGYTAEGKPAYADGSLIADSSDEIKCFAYARISSSATFVSTRTFKYKRDCNNYATYRNRYLVCRIDGYGADIARGLVDKAIYAEKYLMRQSSTSHPHHILTLIDSDHGKRGHGHGAYACDMSRYMQGYYSGSPWNIDNSHRSWYAGEAFETVCDYGEDGSWHGLEVGENGHLPAVAATMDGAPVGNEIRFEDNTWNKDAPFFFPIGCTVTSTSGGSAEVVSSSWSSSSRRIVLDNSVDFNNNDLVKWSWGGQFPMSPMFIYTFYTYLAYRDVYTFPVGSFGKHMDSASGADIRSYNGKWCSQALKRNITSTCGTVAEPSSWGESRMSYAMYALAHGCDAADAWYNSMYFGMNWMVLMLTDPLYAPLRDFNSHTNDARAPVLGEIRTLDESSDERVVEVDIWGLYDLCQCRVEYGTNVLYGQMYDFYDFSGALSGDWSSARYYFFSKQFSCTLDNLVTGQVYHYRVTARDPYGNETVSSDYTFEQGGTNTLERPNGVNNAPTLSSDGFAAVSGGPVDFSAVFLLGQGIQPGEVGLTGSDADSNNWLTFTVERTSGTYTGTVEPTHSASTNGNSAVGIEMTTSAGLDGTGTLTYAFMLTDDLYIFPVTATLTIDVLVPEGGAWLMLAPLLAMLRHRIFS